MAEQREPVKRRVALKIIKVGMDTREVVARFEAERQALAMMDHPNIAKVHDGGATDTGRLYFVMELVRGVPITQYCDENQLPTSERLRLFAQVCQAVQHAHQKGIIVGREECFPRARSRRPRERSQTTILIQQGLAGQLHCFCDGGLADFAAASSLKDELPGESSLHIGQNIRHEDAGAFESGFAVANGRVGHDISAQLDSRRGSFLCRSHGPNLSCPQPPDKVRERCEATTLRVSQRRC